MIAGAQGGDGGAGYSSHALIRDKAAVDLVFAELLSPMVRDQADGTLFAPRMAVIPAVEAVSPEGGVGAFDWVDIVEEQEWVSRVLHRIGYISVSSAPPVEADGVEVEKDAADDGGEVEKDAVDDVETVRCLRESFSLLKETRRHLGEGGGVRIRFTIPPLAWQCIRLARHLGRCAKRLRASKSDETEDSPAYTLTRQTLSELYRFLHVTVATLLKAQESFMDDVEDGGIGSTLDPSTLLFGTGGSRSVTPTAAMASLSGSSFGVGLMSPPDMALRLFLECAKSANETLVEDLAYEFLVQVSSSLLLLTTGLFNL